MLQFFIIRFKTTIKNKKLLLFPLGDYGYTIHQNIGKYLLSVIEDAAKDIDPNQFNIFFTFHPDFISSIDQEFGEEFKKIKSKYSHIIINKLSKKRSKYFLPYVSGILSNGSGVGIQGKLIFNKPLFMNEEKSASINLADGNFTSANTFFKNNTKPKAMTNVLYYLFKYLFIPRIFARQEMFWYNYLTEKVSNMQKNIKPNSMEFYSNPIISDSEVIQMLIGKKYKNFESV
jgi:hypothetical protein